MNHFLEGGGFVLRTHGHSVVSFVPISGEAGVANFFENAVMGKFEPESVFQSVIGVVIHDGFTSGVVGLFGLD